MRRTLGHIPWFAIALWAALGCGHTDWFYKSDAPAKPPLHEEYVLPPSDDPRFSSPPVYPKETLDSGILKKDSGKPGDPFKGPSRFGASGPGMGGY